jgi:hypothetical protein
MKFRITGRLLLVLALAGCATSHPQRAAQIARLPGQARVLLMPADVEAGIVTASGLYKPRADWTEAAQRNLLAAFEAELRTRGAALVPYTGPLAAEHVQTAKLVGALEQTLLTFVYGPGGTPGRPRLPTKASGLDWTLGEAVVPLRERYAADYALFVHVRDRSPTAGRTAANIAIALLFGAIATSSEQIGFALLLDLHSGRLLWSNLAGSAFGDVREPAGATGAARALLEDFPA